MPKFKLKKKFLKVYTTVPYIKPSCYVKIIRRFKKIAVESGDSTMVIETVV